MNEHMWMSGPIFEARAKGGVKFEPDQGGGLKVVLDKHGVGLPDVSDEEMAYMASIIEKDMKAWAAKVAPSVQSGAISHEEFKVLMMNHMKKLADEYQSGQRPLPPPPASMGTSAAGGASKTTPVAGVNPQQIEAAKKFILAQVATRPVFSTINLHRMMPAGLKGPVYEKALFALADEGKVIVGQDADITSFSDEDRALLPKDGNQWVGYVMPADTDSSPKPAPAASPVPQAAPKAPLAAPRPAASPVAPAAEKPVRYEKAADVQAGLQKLGPDMLRQGLTKTSWPNLSSIAAELGCPTKDGNRNLKVEELVNVIMARLTGQPMPKLAPAAPVVKKTAPEMPRKSQASDMGDIIKLLQQQGAEALRLTLSKRPWQDLKDIYVRQFKGNIKGAKGNLKTAELVDAIIQAAEKELGSGSAFVNVADKRAAVERGRQIAAQVPQQAPKPPAASTGLLAGINWLGDIDWNAEVDDEPVTPPPTAAPRSGLLGGIDWNS